MMTRHGHDVIVYAGAHHDGSGVLVPCITEAQQRRYGFAGPSDYEQIEWDAYNPYWLRYNTKCVAEIGKRWNSESDVILLTSGTSADVAKLFGPLAGVEWSIGYSGCVLPLRIYESYAAMHGIQGFHGGNNDYHEVIPSFFDPDEFPAVTAPDDYLAFVGRLGAHKGLDIAQRVAQQMGRRLIVAGPGTFTGYGEYVGVLGPTERTKLLAHAAAVLCPTQYLEPFCNVHVEAMLCGTPVVASDYGVFTETLPPEHRCRSLADYVAGVSRAETTDRALIRSDATTRFSYATVAPQFSRYFDKALALRAGMGWDAASRADPPDELPG